MIIVKSRMLTNAHDMILSSITNYKLFTELVFANSLKEELKLVRKSMKNCSDVPGTHCVYG